MKEEKCSECHGEGELKIPVIPPYYMVYPPKDVSHAKVEFRRIPCPICRGTGRRPIRSAPRMADTLKGAAALGSLHIHPHINMQDIQDILAQLFGNQVPITATFAAAMRPGVSPVDPKIPDEESRFEKDWRSEMPRTWKGWSQTDIRKSFAKVWIDESKGVHMKRRTKPWSIEEDYAQDAHEQRYTEGYPSETANIQPIGHRSLMIDKWEEYDPGGKRAHEIAGKFRD